MTALYHIAQFNKGLVVGTGNKVEDFGVGFFTKYGDGGVDISPIADCMKSEVWDMGEELQINQAIINAEPTDGLWDDARVDTDQLGMSYAELEEAMKWGTGSKHYERYAKLRIANLHKMNSIPICYMT
jgi:NAD+ synthase